MLVGLGPLENTAVYGAFTLAGSSSVVAGTVGLSFVRCRQNAWPVSSLVSQTQFFQVPPFCHGVRSGSVREA